MSASVQGRLKARTDVSREWYPNGVSHRALTLESDGVVGDLYLARAGSDTHPAVLTFGGSEGGVSGKGSAALFAAHGYTALALGYFGLPGLPATLKDVAIEYFAHAARLLAQQPGVDAGHVITLGYSRGSEAALLLAQDFPDVVHGAVVYAPSAVVNPGFPSGASAWTVGGVELVAGPAIPVDRIAGPVLAIAGTDDQLWSSARWAEQIDLALTDAHHAYPHQVLLYAGSGHKVGTYPFLPSGTRATHPVTGQAMNFGGTRAGDEAAKRDGWTKVLALVAGTM
jgi:dienelactone hydrolase